MNNTCKWAHGSLWACDTSLLKLFDYLKDIAMGTQFCFYRLQWVAMVSYGEPKCVTTLIGPSFEGKTVVGIL